MSSPPGPPFQPWNEDPLEGLARELRQGAGAELRAEAEIAELESEIGRRRHRSSSDLAREAAMRGDGVSVIIQGRTITGAVVHVGKDYLSVETGTEQADARLDRIALVLNPGRQGGVTPRGGSITFKARLSEYEQTGETVELVATGLAFAVRGTIEVVATDHVIVRDVDGTRTSLPVELIDLALRPRRPR
jgi:hypothetical protein